MPASSCVLVDMDGVIADLDASFERAWRSEFPARELIPLSDRKSPRIPDDYPPEFEEDIYRILSAPGFVHGTPEIPHAIESLKRMRVLQIDVYICSSPLLPYSNNVA